MKPSHFFSLAAAFIMALINDPANAQQAQTLLPQDVRTKIASGLIRPQSNDIYLRALTVFTPNGNTSGDLMPTGTKRAKGITNLEDGLKIPKNEIFCATHISFGYATTATPTTADAVYYSNASLKLSAGAYVQRIPTLVLNTEIEYIVGGRTVFSGLISDLCIDNNIATDPFGKIAIPLDAPCIITDQDIVQIKLSTPAGGAVVGGTITEYVDARFIGARIVPKA